MAGDWHKNKKTHMPDETTGDRLIFSLVALLFSTLGRVTTWRAALAKMNIAHEKERGRGRAMSGLFTFNLEWVLLV